MGFSGGGANVTKAHQHDGTVIQDGGALDFNNVTQAGLSAGDLTFSNGTALQVLGLGSATDTLTVNAGETAPEWVAAAVVAGGSLELLDNQEVSIASTTITATFSPALTEADYSEIIVVLTFAPSDSNPESLITVNGISSSYHTDGGYIEGGSQTLVDLNNQGSATIGYNAEANRSNAALVHIHMADASYTGTKSSIMLVDAMSGGSVYFSAGLQCNSTIVDIDEIEVSLSSGDYQIGSKMAIYGRKRT